MEHKEEKNEYLLGSLNFLKKKNFKEDMRISTWTLMRERERESVNFYAVVPLKKYSCMKICSSHLDL